MRQGSEITVSRRRTTHDAENIAAVSRSRHLPAPASTGQAAHQLRDTLATASPPASRLCAVEHVRIPRALLVVGPCDRICAAATLASHREPGHEATALQSSASMARLLNGLSAAFQFGSSQGAYRSVSNLVSSKWSHIRGIHPRSTRAKNKFRLASSAP